MRGGVSQVASKCINHRTFQALNYKSLVHVINRQGCGGSVIYLYCGNILVADYGFLTYHIATRLLFVGDCAQKVRRIEYEIEVGAYIYMKHCLAQVRLRRFSCPSRLRYVSYA